MFVIKLHYEKNPDRIVCKSSEDTAYEFAKSVIFTECNMDWYYIPYLAYPNDSKITYKVYNHFINSTYGLCKEEQDSFLKYKKEKDFPVISIKEII